ncbi:MAG: HPr family phosphocarrier protein [Novosphingobium sp.]|nr:HPr family phosphocarrier protein [Novosphingobium sp.]
MSTVENGEARETVLIVNTRGLHARASAKFVNAVAALPDGVQVKVSKDGAEAEGGSILGLMMLGAAKGDTIEIAVSGDGGGTVLPQLVGLVKDGFGED